MINTELSSEHKTTRILLHPFILVKDQKTVPWDPKKEPPFFFSFFCLRRDLNTWVNVMLHRPWPWGPGEQEGMSSLPHSSPVAGTLLDKQALEKARIRRAVQHTFRAAGVQQRSSWDGQRTRNKQCWWGCGVKGTLGHCWWECELCSHYADTVQVPQN